MSFIAINLPEATASAIVDSLERIAAALESIDAKLTAQVAPPKRPKGPPRGLESRVRFAPSLSEVYRAAYSQAIGAGMEHGEAKETADRALREALEVGV